MIDIYSDWEEPNIDEGDLIGSMFMGESLDLTGYDLSQSNIHPATIKYLLEHELVVVQKYDIDHDKDKVNSVSLRVLRAFHNNDNEYDHNNILEVNWLNFKNSEAIENNYT